MKKLAGSILLLLLLLSEQSKCSLGWIHPSHQKSLGQLSKAYINSPSPQGIFHMSSSSILDESSDSSILRELYPQWLLLENQTLQVDDIHNLSYQVYGHNSSSSSTQQQSLVGLFLHGGPGAACFPNHARFFDPDRYHRVVLLDQRGCGKSTPTACLDNNTLLDLVNDCELLREHLQLPQWDVVLGGSWGTTLSIAYGQLYPQSMRSMILRGIFLFRPQEVDWLFSSTGGAAKQYPDTFQRFCQAVDVDMDDSNPLAALHEYYRRLWASNNETERSNAARSWMQWEFFNSVAYKIPPSANLSDSNATMQAIRSWKPPPNAPVAVYSPYSKKWAYESVSGSISENDGPSADYSSIQETLRKDISIGYNSHDPPRASVPTTPTTPYYSSQETISSSNLPVQVMLTCYYSTNVDWCRNYIQLLDPKRMKSLQAIPCIAIQGGSDGICPPDSALDLLKQWPTMELRVPLHAGHSMYDPLITNELVRATDRMADLLLGCEESTSSDGYEQ